MCLRQLAVNQSHAASSRLCTHSFRSAHAPSRVLHNLLQSHLSVHQLPHSTFKRVPVTRATKHGQPEADRQAAGEWAALAYSEEQEQIPEGLQETLNKICNAGLKLMLKDCTTREIEEYKDKVSELGASFSEKNDLQGATFAYVLYSMAEHVQVKAVDNLQGVYKTACLKMFGLLEDSGWKLNKEGEEDTEMPEDQQPLPDVPTLGSYSGII